MLERKLIGVSYASLCNVVVLVLEGNITRVIFSSWCNVFDGNVVVPIGKLT